jgi:hypothetical protein
VKCCTTGRRDRVAKVFPHCVRRRTRFHGEVLGWLDDSDGSAGELFDTPSENDRKDIRIPAVPEESIGREPVVYVFS